MYTFSGVVMIFRETDFLKSEILVNKTIDAGLRGEGLSKTLHKKIDVTGAEGDVVLFRNGEYSGQYNSKTGDISYKSKELPIFLQKMTGLHKSTDDNIVYLFTVTYACLLLFLALSSFFMFKTNSKLFKKGLMVSALGVLLSFLLIL
jgi:hypothetical protein